MSDNELDAELLALAGGDESSSEDEAPISSPRREQPKKSIEKSPPRRGVAQKLKSRAKSRRARNDSEDEDDFGDGSDSDIAPPRARSPSEDADGELDDEAPLYPIEGKFRSEADRSDIMAMTEIEREEILAERAAEAQKRAQDAQLKRLLQARKRDEDGDGKKRKADNDLDDGQRKSSRQKTKATSKIEEYKRQRELKGAQRARGEANRREERSPSRGGDYSEPDADGESDEVEFDEGRRASPPQRDESPPDLHDFNNVRIGRSNFCKYCFYPTFETLIKGCYVRVNVGMESSGPRYRVGQIKAFREGRPYVLDANNGKKVYTNQMITVAFGKSEKDFPFSACSDSRMTDSELSDYRSTLSSDGIRHPAKRQLKAKASDVEVLISHAFNDLDLNAKVDKANLMRKTFENFQRDRIIRRRDEAARRGDDDVVARCNRELAASATGAPPAITKNGSPAKKEDQQARLAALNKANRKTNAEEIRNALIAQKMKQQKSQAAAAARFKEEEERKRLEAEAAAQNGGLRVPGDDLFGDGSDISRAGTPMGGTPKKGRSRAGTPAGGAAREKKVFGQISRRKMDDEVIAAIDLGIDIDL